MWKDWSDSGSWTVITLLFKIERSDTSGATTDGVPITGVGKSWCQQMTTFSWSSPLRSG
jgi:hypothetical protein